MLKFSIWLRMRFLDEWIKVDLFAESVIDVDVQLFLQIFLEILSAVNHTLLEQLVSLLFASEHKVEIAK